VNNNIDDIINHYSMPYEEIYSMAVEEGKGREVVNTIPQTPMPSSLPSVVFGMEQPNGTEIELAYSDFPEEDQYKLPLDSYAQIDSLISNSSSPDTERSYLRHDREPPLSS
jgi:hypothetical protein